MPLIALAHDRLLSSLLFIDRGGGGSLPAEARRFKETLIQSLSDFTLEFLCIARNNLTRIASYLRKAMTKLCIKILVEFDSAIESAFP